MKTVVRIQPTATTAQAYDFARRLGKVIELKLTKICWEITIEN